MNKKCGATMNVEILESRIAPAVLVVTNLTDTAVSGKLDLRQAIANSHSGDTIVFKAGLTGTLVLGGTDLAINHPLTITGPGANKVIISGNNASNIFDVTGFSTHKAVTISGLALIDGNAVNGGAIYSTESLTLKSCVISGNTGGDGAGVAAFPESFATGTVAIVDCVATGNTGTGGTFGGGLDLGATKSVIVTGCKILGNTDGSGGGLYARVDAAGKSLTISNDVIRGNSATHGAGMDLKDENTASTSKVRITGTTVAGNVSTSAGGGIFAEQGNFVITNSTLTGNKVNTTQTSDLYDGGGFYSTGATSVTITGGKIEDNSGVYGGGIALVGAFPASLNGVLVAGNSATETGGGLVTNHVTTLSVTGSTFDGNTAQIGAGLDLGRTGKTTISGSTIANNVASNYGGGIHVIDNTAMTTTTIKASKIIGNIADVEGGGGSFNTASSVNVISTVIADNEALGTSSGNGGGGLQVLGTTSYSITGSTFTDNFAAHDGGGLYIGSSSTGSFGTTAIKYNVAGVSGGGLYFDNTGQIKLGPTDQIVSNVAPTDSNLTPIV